jgi:hypothetical protein
MVLYHEKNPPGRTTRRLTFKKNQNAQLRYSVLFSFIPTELLRTFEGKERL